MEVGWTSTGLLVKLARAIYQSTAKHLRYDVEDIITDLRSIRFSDEGIIALIENALNDKDISAGKTLVDFHDFENRAANIAERLSRKYDCTSYLTHEDMRLIGWRKTEIREEVGRLLYGYGQNDFVPDKGELKLLLEGIKELNLVIDNLEHDLMKLRK